MGFCGDHTQSLQLLSKMAADGGHGEDSPYFDGWKAYESDPYHPTTNPSGVIQMGLAENQLCADVIEEWIKRHPEASICTPEGVHAFKDIANFQDYHGLPKFRHAVAKFMSTVRGGRVRFDPDRIVMSGGATGANETVMFCLADPGDAFLVPSPYYTAFDRDLTWRTRAQIVPVFCHSSDGFRVTREAVEAAYQKARAAGMRVRGLILVNPSNPLGTVLGRGTLASMARFAADRRVHLVCDEIYAASVFAAPEFVSIAEVIGEAGGFFDPNLVHIVYSLSKDMGLPGFRAGIVYSYNDDVVAAARKMSSFGLVSSQTQHLLAALLSDDAFVGRFLAESARRLGARRRDLTVGLERVGIRCLKSGAGLYCWMDLRWMLEESTVEAELKLWRVILHDVKLNISPGSSFRCSEPGWFRVCFANMDEETLAVALGRMRRFVRRREADEEVEVQQEEPGPPLPPLPQKQHPAVTGKKRWQSNAPRRLSFKAGRLEETVLGPSPHSPLLKAST